MLKLNWIYLHEACLKKKQINLRWMDLFCDRVVANMETAETSLVIIKRLIFLVVVGNYVDVDYNKLTSW